VTKPPVVIVGLGQLGHVFARGFLKCLHPVYPITRQVDPSALAVDLPDPCLVLVAVGEKDLGPVLGGIPAAWKNRLAFVQNELLPPAWESQGITDPTVMPVWFEKKPGFWVKVVRPSPVYGPGADWITGAMESLDIPTRRIDDRNEMLFELVLKNVYILTLNIAGLVGGQTAGSLWKDHRALAGQVASEVIDIQQAVAGRELDRDRLVRELGAAIQDRPGQKTTGRSAPERLYRALAQADAAGLAVGKLREIQNRISLPE
jgi:hypothetical protein